MIKKMILTAFSVLCLSMTASADKIVTEDNVVQIFTKRGFCSGTQIGKDTVLTAAHCISDGKVIETSRIGIRHQRGELTTGVTGAVDIDRDLALILTRGNKVPTGEMLNLGDDPAKDQETVILMGFGEGETNVDIIRAGVIGLLPKRVKDADVLDLALDVNSIGGMSGGPVININHQLIGVISRGVDPMMEMLIGKQLRLPISLNVAAVEIRVFLREAGLNV